MRQFEESESYWSHFEDYRTYPIDELNEDESGLGFMTHGSRIEVYGDKELCELIVRLLNTHFRSMKS